MITGRTFWVNPPGRPPQSPGIPDERAVVREYRDNHKQG